MPERSIGVYVRRYMTSDEYEFMGVMLSTSMLERTISGRKPEILHFEKSEQKNKRRTQACSLLMVYSSACAKRVCAVSNHVAETAVWPSAYILPCTCVFMR